MDGVEQNEINNLLVKLIKTSVGDTADVRVLERKLKDKVSHKDQIREQINTKKTIDWATIRIWYNRHDLERWWESLLVRPTVQKNQVFEITSEFSGQHLVGLNLQMDGEAVDRLVAAEPRMCTFGADRRRKFNDERRNMRKNDGQIQWMLTLQALKEFAEENRYVPTQIHKMVLEIAQQELPSFASYFETMTLQQLSDHLISLDPIKYKKQEYIDPLKNLVRKTGTPLISTLNIANQLYRLSKDKNSSSLDQNDPHFCADYLQFAIDALIKLTDTKVSTKLREYIHETRNSGKKLKYNSLLLVANEMENNGLAPTRDLRLDYLKEDLLSVKINNISAKSPTLDKKQIDSSSESGSSSSDEDRPIIQKSKVKIRQTRPAIEPDRAISPSPIKSKANMMLHWPIFIMQATLADPLADAYQQVVEDNNMLTRDEDKVLKIALGKVESTVRELTEAKNDEKMVYKKLIERLRDNNLSTRIIGAILIDERIIDFICTRPNVSRRKKFEKIMQQAASPSEQLSINNISYKNWNRNSKIVMDRQKNRSRSYDRSPSVERKREGRSPHKYATKYYVNEAQPRGYANRARDYSRSHSRESCYRRSTSRENQYPRRLSRTPERKQYRTPSRDRNSYHRRDRSTTPSRSREGKRDRSNSRLRWGENEYKYFQKERRRDRRDRTVSPFTKQSMLRGRNCQDDYNPSRRFCDKCDDPSHHPWNCALYTGLWSRIPCKNCNKNHKTEECRQKEQLN